MIDLEELERIAKAATPGPWRGDRIDGTVKYDIVAGDYPNDYTVVCHGDNGNACDGGYGFTSAENEDYVLAANPSVVLALIAEVRALREDAAMARDEILAIASRHVFIPKDGTDGVTEGELLNFARAILQSRTARGAK